MLKQPEVLVTCWIGWVGVSGSYLREALEEIAHLNKPGRYALNFNELVFGAPL